MVEWWGGVAVNVADVEESLESKGRQSTAVKYQYRAPRHTSTMTTIVLCLLSG